MLRVNWDPHSTKFRNTIRTKSIFDLNEGLMGRMKDLVKYIVVGTLCFVIGTFVGFDHGQILPLFSRTPTISECQRMINLQLASDSFSRNVVKAYLSQVPGSHPPEEANLAVSTGDVGVLKGTLEWGRNPLTVDVLITPKSNRHGGNCVITKVLAR